jgi:AAA domain
MPARYGQRVTRRRDARRFGRGPYVLALRRVPELWGSGFPFYVPAVAACEELALGDAPVTLLAGDNGSGKSTLVEAIAEAMGFAPQGGELERSGELPPVRSTATCRCTSSRTASRSSGSRRTASAARASTCSPVPRRRSTGSTAPGSRAASTTTSTPCA